MTSGYELMTAITNLVIFITSVIIFINIKNNKTWSLFFKLIMIDSFLGIIVHGINMSNTLYDILWGILCILFVITFNILLHIFGNIKLKNIAITSILISIILVLEVLFNLNYVITFIIYAIIVVLSSIYLTIKNKYQNKEWFISGIVVQLIGVIPTFLKLGIGNFNHNCITHTFTLITIIIFYIGIKKSR